MFVNVAVFVLALPELACAGYLGALALLSTEQRDDSHDEEPITRFDVIVPAHNEELGIEATVKNLLAVDYPPSMRRVVVVADNCSDKTADRARAAGADVMERTDKVRRGKGYALAYAFERSIGERGERAVDAVVVVDADTKVSSNLLRAFDARLRKGAQAAQAEYCVANPDASWRTRLMHIGFTLFHDVRSRARERLGLSAGLRGNGMAFSTAVLKEVPHEAFSIVEDVEYGIRLGLAGHRVHYAGHAKVYGEMVASEEGSRSQRSRWEGGRLALVRQHALPLLREAWRRKSVVLLDLAADLLVPPLTYVVITTFGGTAVALAWVALGGGAWWAAAPWLLASGLVLVYVGRGLWLAGVGPRAVVDLAYAPVYMVWKVALAARTSAKQSAPQAEWVRTAREGEAR
ncbi:MAG TPA: glycosyltransferase family 2 protein [Polyangiaceae bacterium]|jgi:1,2-diacylglycerol 3-beta-glucosyltransferase|nr:glycosyltransferase family 2 protein [Polyangiaceae bacterium]